MAKAWIFENENQLKAAFGMEPALAARMVPCQFWQADGPLHLVPDKKLPSALAAKLDQFGIVNSATEIPKDAQTIDAPWKLFSLATCPLGDTFGAKPPDALFLCPNHAVAVDLVSRLISLGCDRIQAGEIPQGRVAIRAESAPLFVVWTAMDSGQVQVLLEGPGDVYCPIGKKHPLGDQLVATEGTWLILGDPRGGENLDKLSLTPMDGQWVLKTSPPNHLQVQPWDEIIPIPLRLEKTNLPPGQPALWRIDRDLMPRFLEWVGKAPEEQICQFEWTALGDAGADAYLVRPMVPTAHLELPVHSRAFERVHPLEPVYIPVGTRISPPLRMEKIRAITHLSPGTLAWLETDNSHPKKLAQANTLASSSFRPLESCLEFQLVADPTALSAWSDGIEFKDLEDLISIPPEMGSPGVHGPGPSPVGKSSDSQPSSIPPKPDMGQSLPAEPAPKTPNESGKPRKKSKKNDIPSHGSTHSTNVASQALEQWLARPGPLHSTARLEAIPQLATVLEEADRPGDAADALLITFWHSSPSSSTWSNANLQEVAKLEAHSLALRGGKRAKNIQSNPALVLEDPDLGGDLRTAASRWFAMDLAAAPEKAVLKPSANSLLEKLEEWLPIRHAWLAWRNWHSVTGDIASLGKAHDRLLRRLSRGLQVGRDSPPFIGGKLLREKGGRSDAGRLLTTLVEGFGNRLHLKENDPADRVTRALAFAMFAAGAFRVGDSIKAASYWDQCKASLLKEGTLGRILLAGIDEKLTQVRSGHPADNSLVALSPEGTKNLNPNERYRIDNLRKNLSFFEPAQTIDPVIHYLSANSLPGGGNPMRDRAVAIQNAQTDQLTAYLLEGLSDLEAFFGLAQPISKKGDEMDLALQLLQAIQERAGQTTREIALRSLKLGKLITRRILENADPAKKDLSLHFCLRLLRGAFFAAGPWGLRDEVDQWLHAALEPDGESPGLFALLVRTGQGRWVGALLQEMVSRLRAWDMETAGFALVDGLDKALPLAIGEDHLTLGLILAAQLGRRGQTARAEEVLGPCREGIRKAREPGQPLKGQALEQRLELARGLMMFALESDPSQGQDWINAAIDLLPSLLPASPFAGGPQVAHVRILKVIETMVLSINSARDIDAKNGWCEEEEAILRRVILAQGKAILA